MVRIALPFSLTLVLEYFCQKSCSLERMNSFIWIHSWNQKAETKTHRGQTRFLEQVNFALTAKNKTQDLEKLRTKASKAWGEELHTLCNACLIRGVEVLMQQLNHKQKTHKWVHRWERETKGLTISLSSSFPTEQVYVCSAPPWALQRSVRSQGPGREHTQMSSFPGQLLCSAPHPEASGTSENPGR